ncbi:response regulator [Paenibacillus sp. GCM10012303]|uniref:response regulator n=1 Tax=Paenibacillus sp. GCM10012303 TaxID=3317340 RepID=UPI0036142CB5
MITIVIADDQMLIREGLGTILNLEEDMSVVGLATNGLEAVEMTARLRPKLVMMDIQMPHMDGITALKQIKASSPETLVLILSTYLEDKYIVEGMANGASGYLLKDMDTNKMIAAIRDTVSGQYILPASVATKLVHQITELSKGHSAAESWSKRIELTQREREVAELIVQGYTNREIAAELHIAEGTARNYISQLYSKLEVLDRVQALVRLQALL